MLVLNGTKRPAGNRMEEDACMLAPCLDENFHRTFLAAIQSESIPRIISELQFLDGMGVNLVGSRGHVYQSGKLADSLANLSVPGFQGVKHHCNHFPRTAGLRKAIINGFTKIEESL